MQKRKLTIEEVEELVRENCYRVEKKSWFLSRCIDGRYRFKTTAEEPSKLEKNNLPVNLVSDQRSQKTEIRGQKTEGRRQNSDNQSSDLSDFCPPSSDVSEYNRTSEVGLEPLAKPGADIGDLMMAFCANREYGLEIESEKIFAAVLKAVGGFKNFRFHTDSHNVNSNEDLAVDSVRFFPPAECSPDVTSGCASSGSLPNLPPTAPVNFYKIFLGCGHFKQAAKDPSVYGLVEEEIKAINGFLKEAIKKGAKCEILPGEHLEGAVLLVKGDHWSVAPQLISNSEIMEAFVYQKTLDNKRRKILVKHLLPYVKAPFSVDEEYLYQILSQVTDNQLLETVNRLAKDLPMYEVEFEGDGGFEIRKF